MFDTLYKYFSWIWRRISPIIQITAVLIFVIINWIFALALIGILATFNLRYKIRDGINYLWWTFIRLPIKDYRYGRYDRKEKERRAIKEKIYGK